MKILDAGHDYELESYDGGDPQHLTFMKREGEGFPFNKGSHGGTNCQEVLRALINRTQYLNQQIPCAETEAAIASMQTALLLFELRAAKRHDRKLEVPDLNYLVRSPTCPKCSHVDCKGHTSD